MKIKNFLEQEAKEERSHNGKGLAKQVLVFGNDELESRLEFLYYTILPSGASIGEHKHGNNEEVYIIAEGTGLMTIDGELREVKSGDVIVNKPYGTHTLLNNSDKEMKIFVFEVAI